MNISEFVAYTVILASAGAAYGAETDGAAWWPFFGRGADPSLSTHGLVLSSLLLVSLHGCANSWDHLPDLSGS